MGGTFVVRLMICRHCLAHYVEGANQPSMTYCRTGGSHAYQLVLVVAPCP